jgi:hypothetical protein
MTSASSNFAYNITDCLVEYEIIINESYGIQNVICIIKVHFSKPLYLNRSVIPSSVIAYFKVDMGILKADVYKSGAFTSLQAFKASYK